MQGEGRSAGKHHASGGTQCHGAGTARGKAGTATGGLSDDAMSEQRSGARARGSASQVSGESSREGGTEENVPRASKGPLSMDAFENCSGARL